MNMNLWHIGVLTESLEKTINTYGAIPGTDSNEWHIREMTFTPEDMRVSAGGTLKTAMCMIGGVCLEFIEPLTETSYHYQELKKKGPGIHHVAYSCPDDMAEVLKALLEKGGRVVWEIQRKEHVCYVELPDEGSILEIIDVNLNT
jgi:methylmalonyl-CoA/ethylmalonyl-CoA epimerase